MSKKDEGGLKKEFLVDRKDESEDEASEFYDAADSLEAKMTGLNFDNEVIERLSDDDEKKYEDFNSTLPSNFQKQNEIKEEKVSFNKNKLMGL